MVVIHHKKTDIDQFLYECRTTDPNDTVIRDLVSKSAFGTNNNLPEHHALGIVGAGKKETVFFGLTIIF